MRNLLTVFGLAALGSLIIIAAGCSTFGANPGPPTKLEQHLFDTQTNVVTVTNMVREVVPVFTTNTVTQTITNQQNQVVTTTSNIVNQIWETNQVQRVVNQTNYVETPKASVTSGAQVSGAVLNALVPGAGGLASTGITALLGLWAWLRSSKTASSNGTTASALSQEVETLLEFVGALPNGQTYVSALKNFLQAHQNEAGVTQQVLAILENDVSNPNAKIAAQSVITAINALKPLPAPLAPISAAPQPA